MGAFAREILQTLLLRREILGLLQSWSSSSPVSPHWPLAGCHQPLRSTSAVSEEKRVVYDQLGMTSPAERPGSRPGRRLRELFVAPLDPPVPSNQLIKCRVNSSPFDTNPRNCGGFQTPLLCSVSPWALVAAARIGGTSIPWCHRSLCHCPRACSQGIRVWFHWVGETLVCQGFSEVPRLHLGPVVRWHRRGTGAGWWHLSQHGHPALGQLSWVPGVSLWHGGAQALARVSPCSPVTGFPGKLWEADAFASVFLWQWVKLGMGFTGEEDREARLEKIPWGGSHLCAEGNRCCASIPVWAQQSCVPCLP